MRKSAVVALLSEAKPLELLKKLGVARAVVVCHKSAVTSVLAAHAIANIATEEGVSATLAELSPVSKEALFKVLEARGVSWNGVVVYSLSEARGELPVVVHAVGVDPSGIYKPVAALGRSVRVIFTHAAKRLGIVAKAPVLRLSEAPGGILKAQLPGSAPVAVEVSFSGVSEALSYESREKLLKAAREILLSSMSEYGQITLKDAINILSASLGVSRGDARSVLYELLQLKMLKAKRGVLEL